jgi:hypothetical protein
VIKAFIKWRGEVAARRLVVEELRGQIRDFTQSLRPLETTLGVLEAKKKVIMSERGSLLIEHRASPGVDIRIYERWVESTQGLSGPIDRTTVVFEDNSSKIAIYNGSETTTKGSIGGRAWTSSNGTLSSTSGTFRAKSTTINDVEMANSGSAYISLSGEGVRGVITYDDPHAAAVAANTILRCSQELPAFLASKESALVTVELQIENAKAEIALLSSERELILQKASELSESVLSRQVPEIGFIRSISLSR